MDIVVVQKQTTLERYTRRALNIDFFEYLEKAGQNVEPLVTAHEAHCRTRDALLALLDQLGTQYQLFNLDELNQSNFDFFSPDKDHSGLRPNLGLVIALGGDGTLLHASHYVGGDVVLFGINSTTDHSVGHLCSANASNFSDVIREFIESKISWRAIRRLRVQSEVSPALPLGLNDVLFCNRHPAATCRYEMKLMSKFDETVEKIEKQLSSGIWISGPAGSTAAISSYGLPRLSPDSSSFLYAVREPYSPAPTQMTLGRGQLDGNLQRLSLFSRIRQGLVCIDGPDFSFPLGFGDRIEIDLPQDGSLRLLMTSSKT